MERRDLWVIQVLIIKECCSKNITKDYICMEFVWTTIILYIFAAAYEIPMFLMSYKKFWFQLKN